MKKTNLTLLILFFSAILTAQNGFFNKKISGNKLAASTADLIPTDDNGFIMGGTWQAENYKTYGYITKFNNTGQVEWAKKTINNIDSSYHRIYSLKNGNFFWIHSKNNFELLSSNLSSLGAFKLPNFNILNFLELSNGNIVLSGLIKETKNLQNSSKNQIAMLNSNGAVIWTKSYSINQIPIYELPPIKETNDGQLICCFAGIDSTNNFIDLCKISAQNGTILSESTINTKNEYYYRGNICQDNNGNIYVCVSLGEPGLPKEPNILKFDKNGVLLWSKVYSVNSTAAQSFIEKKDGNFMLVVQERTDPFRSYYLSINQNGDIVTQFSEASRWGSLKSWYLKNGELVSSSVSKYDCDQNRFLYLDKRANDGKNACSEVSSIGATPKTFAPYTIVPMTVDQETFFTEKGKPLVFENDKLWVRNNYQYCQDTTFKKTLCKGNFYQGRTKKYYQSGVYRDTFPTTDCDSIVLFRLTFIDNSKAIQSKTQKLICDGKFVKIAENIYSEAGIYIDTLRNAFGCDSIVQTDIKIEDLQISITPDMTVNTAEKTQLNVSSISTIVKWQWSPTTYLSCADCSNPFTSPLQSIVYTVKATNDIGCTAKATIKVDIKPCNQIFIPNSFSPNGDGINDELTVFANVCAINVKNYQIFDRWGNQIFEAKDFAPNDATFAWNGKYKGEKVQAGIYLYRIEIEFTDGRSRQFSGDIAIE